MVMRYTRLAPRDVAERLSAHGRDFGRYGDSLRTVPRDIISNCGMRKDV